MSRRKWPRSLLWKFAGAFFLVLIAAAILQWVVLAFLLEPIARNWAETRAELSARDAALAIGDALAQSSETDISAILREYRPDRGWLSLVYRGADSVFITDRSQSGRGFGERRLQRMMERLVDSLPPPEPRQRRDDRDGFPRRRFTAPRLLARFPVIVNNIKSGDVYALSMVPPAPFLPEATPWPTFLYLPIAVVLAGAAGLIMFRSLTKRLRRLEQLAARVADGDLSARVPDPGRDEIGRLGSRLNRMTESLAEARARIEANDQQRRQLLADITHELATPLTSIRGYAETLLEPSVSVSDEEHRRYLQDILGEAERLDLLTQDLLDLTRLEAGAAALQLEKLDWSALCRNTIDRFIARFQEQGLTLKGEGLEQSAWIEADGRRMEQVLENLLTNTLRYVPKGGTVTATIKPGKDGEKSLFLTVSDDGPGFPPDSLPHVFDRFYRSDTARTTGGTGLGLAIVKEIILRHGGGIRAENRQPTGAAIIIELPAAQ